MYLAFVRLLAAEPGRSEHAANPVERAEHRRPRPRARRRHRLRPAGYVLVIVVIALLVRRNREHGLGRRLARRGAALIAALAWLVPWYVIWLLPLAALGTSLKLRRVALVFTAVLRDRVRPVHRNQPPESSAST